jgi:preprotein translocase subunit SecY
MTALTLTTGTAFIMWLGEQISDRGIGNGMSLIIFAGIVVGLPHASAEIYSKLATQQWSPLVVILLLAMMVAVVAFIVMVERAQRRISVQYAKRVVGRRVMGGQSTHLPLKVNIGGVIPVIFALLFCVPANFWISVPRKPFLPEYDRSSADWGTAVELALYHRNYLLLLFLYLNRFQPQRSGR